jgi:carboxypeptidase Q
MFVRLLTAWVLGLPLLALAQPQPSIDRPFSDADLKAAASLRDRALQGSGAYEVVASLATEIGPRSAGSEGDRAAVAWALNKLTQLGFQNVRAQDVTVPHWARGFAEVAIKEPWPQPLVAAALGGSVGTGEEGIEGDVVQASNIDALKKLSRREVEGRIVYFNTRTERTRDGHGYDQAVRVRLDGASAAAALGAVAVAIRSIGTDSDRLAHTGIMLYAANTPRIPAVALSNPDADMLERQLGSGRPVTLRLKLSARDLPPKRSANVIGEVAGSGADAGAAHEIVLLGAHLDSWDLGTGALDDGAGVAIVIAAARLIRELKPAPKRTVRVVLFANEEFGLSGANAYAAQAGSELARHVIAMEADLGAGPAWRFETRVPGAMLPKTQFIAKALQPLGVERGGNAAEGGSDLNPLRRQGVPVFDVDLDATKYFDYHHTANDTLDKIDAKALDQSVAAYAVAAYLAAVASGDFGRVPASAAEK